MKNIKLKTDRHYGYAAVMLLLFTLFYPQKPGLTQDKKSKVVITGVKISPYDKAADLLQDSITEKRMDRDADLQEIIASLNKKVKNRRVKYLFGKTKVIHDTVYVAADVEPRNGTAEDYLPKETQPIIIHDTILCPPAKKYNFFQRIFKHKKQ